MKKLLPLLFILSSLVCAQAATTIYDITTANSGKTGAGEMSNNTGNAFTRGFKFSLSSDWFFPVIGDAVDKATLPTQVSLNSLSITMRDNTLRNLIILTGDATQAGASEVVGFSSSAVNSSGIGTWSFSDNVILDSATTYTFVFSSISNSSEWTSTSTIGNKGAQQGIKVGVKGTSLPSSYPDGECFYNNNGVVANNFASTIKLSVSALPVPEPTTATLGLLGMVGFALRRKRCSSAQ